MSDPEGKAMPTDGRCEFIEFNINGYIRVKLTPKGEAMWRESFEDLKLNAPELRKDEDGYSAIQMWEAMNLFGPEMANGNWDLPFETTIRVEI